MPDKSDDQGRGGARKFQIDLAIATELSSQTSSCQAVITKKQLHENQSGRFFTFHRNMKEKSCRGWSDQSIGIHWFLYSMLIVGAIGFLQTYHNAFLMLEKNQWMKERKPSIDRECRDRPSRIFRGGKSKCWAGNVVAQLYDALQKYGEDQSERSSI